MISKKVILTGSFGVGKTSLFNQFIYQQFDDKYITTIGVKVNKKEVNIEGQDLTMILWDIAGEVAQEKVPVSYFLGASGIIYVVDLTRPMTFRNMIADLEFLKNALPDCSLIVVGNKRDLVTDEQLATIMSEISHKPDYLTSAKTGENVESMFLEMGKRLIANNW